MNHLRELLEVCRARQLHFYDEQVPIRFVEDETITMAERSTCFDMGETDDVLFEVIPELCKMPFENCWFEAVLSQSVPLGRPICAGVLAFRRGTAFEAFVFARVRGTWAFCGGVTSASLQGTAFRVSGASGPSEEICRLIIGVVKGFLSAIHCKNIQTKEHRPDAGLQKARQKRGKAPLFSTWTLEIKGSAERGAGLGGTHSSPRVHLRRGHPRQYQPGKWTWVQPCAVGNVAAGGVHKDYAMGNSLLN